MSLILDGLVVSEKILNYLKDAGHKLTLAVILVGDDYGSSKYVEAISKRAKTIGVKVEVNKYPAEISEDDLIKEVIKLNHDNNVQGILMQLPLPKQIDYSKIIETIDPRKDVEGLHPYNLGRLLSNKTAVVPCTVKSVMRILDYYKIEVEKKQVAIIGRSISVGRPLAALLTNRDATVTLCHSKTTNLKEITKNVAIIVVAIGQAEYLDLDYVNSDSVIIDVGINYKDGKTCGDANYDQLLGNVAAITPVPRGVGALTIAMLLENLIDLAKRSE